MPAHKLYSLRSRQSGVSLLEVLIAVLVMAIGLLGIAALQAVSLRNTEDSSERSNAVIQTYAMFDMLRANRSAARSGNYDTGWICEAPDADTRVNKDLGLWVDQMRGTLGPTACGSIDCGSDDCTVSIRWTDARATGGSEETPMVMATTSRL